MNLPTTHPDVIQLTHSLEGWLSIQKDYFMQKAGTHSYDADRNTAYFHSQANFHKKRNMISAIKNFLGIWYDSRPDIERTLLNHFKDISTTTKPSLNTSILHIFQNCITDADNDSLLQIPYDQEIKDVVFQIKPWASPGNDGFQTGFYQHCWSTVGVEVISMVQHFFTHKFMLKAINHIFQVLIPKILHPQTPSDYRPISLCNVSYKIISKIMANRLKPLLPNLICPTQSAYISGRQIQNNVIIAHELTHTMKNKRKGKVSYIGLKLDMSKAFDRLEWYFLFDVLRRFGFH